MRVWFLAFVVCFGSVSCVVGFVRRVGRLVCLSRLLRLSCLRCIAFWRFAKSFAFVALSFVSVLVALGPFDLSWLFWFALLASFCLVLLCLFLLWFVCWFVCQFGPVRSNPFSSCSVICLLLCFAFSVLSVLSILLASRDVVVMFVQFVLRVLLVLFALCVLFALIVPL